MRPYFWGILKFVGFASIFFVLSFLLGARILLAEPTILHLDFLDQEGQKVEGVQGTLVLVVGNYVDKLPLAVTKDGMDLPMDPSWLRSHWPGGKSRLKNLNRVFVFLKGPGYAPLCSAPIQWMGSPTGGLGKEVVVSFPRGKTLSITKGQKFLSVVEFRRPTERFLKLSGSMGKPMAGVHVKSYVFWSRDDDGDLSGGDPLTEGSTDATGRFPVVDGDFTYAFQIDTKAAPGKKAGTVLVVKRFEDKDYPAVLQDDPISKTP